MKLVLDSNVIVAAFAARGLCAALFEACLVEHQIVVSDEILGEVRRALLTKVRMPEGSVDGVVEYLRSVAICRIPGVVDKSICRDSGDAHVLGLAIGSDVECIVTGDKDLITLERIGEVPIISPREWWERQTK